MINVRILFYQAASAREHCLDLSWVAMGDRYEAGLVAGELEKLMTVRTRFRRYESWLQWPTPTQLVEGEGDPHAVSTKALELNIEAIDKMVDVYHGEFVDIWNLQAEALPNCLWLCGVTQVCYCMVL